MTTNIFEKILYGLKVSNDNILVMNEKMDALLKSLTFEESEPAEIGPEEMPNPIM